MYDVQFSDDGSTFTTLISYSDRALAESLVKACAGWLGQHQPTKYWRVLPRDAEAR
jgi:hypothetical protein